MCETDLNSKCLFYRSKVLTNSSRNLKGEGTAIPVEVWTDPEVSGRLSLPDCATVRTCKCIGCQPYALAAFTFQEIFLTLFSLRSLFDQSVTERPQDGTYRFCNNRWQLHRPPFSEGSKLCYRCISLSPGRHLCSTFAVT